MNQTDRHTPEWEYSAYRATLKKNGESFAIVTPDGHAALPLDKEEELLRKLNTHADLVAALEACKRVDEISSILRYIEKRRSDGSFAIAVCKDPDALEWQVLRDEQLKLLADRESALSRARGEEQSNG